MYHRHRVITALVYLAPSLTAQSQLPPSPIPLYEPRAKAADYASSTVFAAESAKSLGAESLAHSIPVSAGGMLFAENHLVIEAAIYGPLGKPESISPEHFTLRLNGKQIPLPTDSPGIVAAGMRDSIWNRSPSLEVGGSVDNAGVVLGRRRPQTGIPDIDSSGRGPSAPRVPKPDQRSGQPAKASVDVREEIERVSLSRCDCKLPTGGLLYFPFRGKLKSIKSMVLQYSPPGGTPVELTLALQ